MKYLFLLICLIIFEASAQDSVITKLKEIQKEHPNKVKEKANSLEDVTDITDLGTGSGANKGFPEEYKEMAIERGLNPFSLPDEATLERMQSEYEREKYLKILIYLVLSMAILFYLFRKIRKSKIKE